MTRAQNRPRISTVGSFVVVVGRGLRPAVNRTDLGTPGDPDRVGTAGAAWEVPPERQWWLRSAQGLAEVTRTERRTGIEGWFDEPVAGEVRTTSSAGRAAPPRWKQATTIWLVFFPMSLLTTVTLGELLSGLPVVARVAITTIVLMPVMTYLLLPWVTARLDWWLHGRSWRDRG